ncbi:MAG: PadR family transcriptional regulator [Provencibacterium sp.]|nr:PadR family transcriptional regulator [Provencibacterium sp.]
MANAALTEAVYYILLSLLHPLHGYGVMQQVQALSSGRVKLAAGTLYGALSTLLEKGWITALPGEGGERKKEYLITETGREMLQAELLRLQELLNNGKRLLEGENNEENHL